MKPAPPLAMLAELTHRCPLRCVYCSNPLELARASAERDTGFWRALLQEAAGLGVLQVHFSGGEPLLRDDLAELIEAAEEAGLYSNLITSGVLLDEARLQSLLRARLQHLQLSLQDDREPQADEWAGAPMHRRKLAALAVLQGAALALTLNVVLHRGNIDRIEPLIELALAAGAGRLELAHAQYHGWAWLNRASLLPDAGQVERAMAVVEAAQARLQGRLVIDHVLPDYFAERPKACMGGWGSRFLVVDPQGFVLPCHHAASLPDAAAPRYAPGALGWIWEESPLFNRFRGMDWMPLPCRDCSERERDFGGCRCQAYALTGDPAATDPACALAPAHALLGEARGAARLPFVLRSFKPQSEPAGASRHNEPLPSSIST